MPTFTATAVKVQAEDNAKEKTKFFTICIIEVQPTLLKGSASRGKCQDKCDLFNCHGAAYIHGYGVIPVGSARHRRKSLEPGATPQVHNH